MLMTLTGRRRDSRLVAKSILESHEKMLKEIMWTNAHVFCVSIRGCILLHAFYSRCVRDWIDLGNEKAIVQVVNATTRKEHGIVRKREYKVEFELREMELARMNPSTDIERMTNSLTKSNKAARTLRRCFTLSRSSASFFEYSGSSRLSTVCNNIAMLSLLRAS